MIRRICDLLYDQGFTISGARNRLQELVQSERAGRLQAHGQVDEEALALGTEDITTTESPIPQALLIDWGDESSSGYLLHQELLQIRAMLTL
jgi:hypothetical protein